MIISSINEVKYCGCKEAVIRPSEEDERCGALNAAGESFKVRVFDRSSENSPLPHVRIRVKLIDDVPKGLIDGFATAVAAKAKTDPAWCRIAVDLRDGETCYSQRWTHDFPSEDEADEFFAETKEFIERNIVELRSMAGKHGDGGPGLRSILDLF